MAWWGEFSFDLDKGRLWRLAGLDLRLCRRQGEWRIETLRRPDQHEDHQDWIIEMQSPEEIGGARLQRHLFTAAPERLRLLPRLADRPVVIRPVSPLFIAPGQSATRRSLHTPRTCISICYQAPKARAWGIG